MSFGVGVWSLGLAWGQLCPSLSAPSTPSPGLQHPTPGVLGASSLFPLMGEVLERVWGGGGFELPWANSPPWDGHRQ